MAKQYFYCLKTFLVLFCVIYLPGLVYFPFFKEGYYSYFQYSGNLYKIFFILASIFLILTFLSFWIMSKVPRLRFPTLNSDLASFFLFITVLIFFFCSVYFFINFSSSFRHKNRLSEAGGIVSLLFFLKPLIAFIVALSVLHVLNGNALGKISRLLLILILISNVLFLNSALQFVIIPIIVLTLFAPSLLVIKLSELKIKYWLLGILFAPTFFFTILLIGVGNKLGYDFVLSQDGLSYLKGFGNILFPRLSTSLFSSVIMFDYFINGVYFSEDVSQGIYSTVVNRFSLIFPTLSFNSDLIATVNRLNYLHVFSSHAERAGASPGIISSIFFMPIFPFSIFIIPLYVAFIFKVVSYHMGPLIRMNFLSMLIVSFLILSLFEAPINVLYLIDPAFFLFVTVVFFSRFLNVKRVLSK